MFVTFIVPTVAVKRNAIYRLGGRLYGTSNAITGPLILGRIVKDAGHHVEVYEELEGPVDYDRLLLVTDVVCIYTMTTIAPRAYELADLFHMKGHARVIIGGMHASALPEEAATHADQVVVGEAESAILDCVEGRATERIVHAKPICDLDSIPFPDYSILKTPVRCANIMTSRGCPFRCSFCTTSRMFAPYRRRSVDSVIAEIRAAHQQGFRYMNFEDDNFTADKDRAKEICRRIIAENLQFKETFFFGRTDLARDPELLDLLAKAHLTRVLMGIESLNQASLDEVNKHQSIDDIKKACAACAQYGIRVIASVVLGLDADTPDDIRRTVQFAKDVGAYQIQPAILTPFPGTPVYDELTSSNRMITNDWALFDMTHVTFQPKHESPWELQQIFWKSCNYFYDIPSALRIWKRFGAEYGLRRIYLAWATSAGVPLAYFVADHFPETPFYKIKHAPWKYANEAGDLAPAKNNSSLATPSQIAEALLDGLSKLPRIAIASMRGASVLVAEVAWVLAPEAQRRIVTVRRYENAAF